MIFLKNCNGNTLKFDNVATLLALGKDTSWEVFGKPVATKTVTSFKESLQDLKKRCQTYIENIETTLEAVTDEEIREHKDIVKAYILSLSDDDVWVVSARDSMFSGWGKSKGKNNHIFCICWSREQADAIESSLRNLRNMSFISRSSLENFISVRTKHYRGTWSIKNGNDCFAWNNHIIKER